VLFSFRSQADVERWHVVTDAYFGGRSDATLALSASGDAAVFSGRCSTAADADADLRRAGYCCAASKVLALGDYLDLEHYSHLVYRVRGDGRRYIANLRVDNMTGSGGDVWQAPLAPPAGAWATVRIPFEAFVMTHRGQLVQRRFPLARSSIISLGVAVSVADDDVDDGVEAEGDGVVAVVQEGEAAAAAAKDGAAVEAASARGGGSGEEAAAAVGVGGGDESGDDDADDDVAAAAGDFFELEVAEIRAEGRTFTGGGA
jgi:NADH dehydrogenase [ubiquinone] 1 alpha subcomplex assembly factor 1